MPLIRNQHKKLNKDYTYYNHAGVPFVGQDPPGLMYRDEYDASTVRMRRAGYGLFNVADTSHEQSGRTLQQVLDRHARSEYEIVVMEQYNNGVVAGDASKPPGLFVFLVWYEKFDTLPKYAKELAETDV